MANSDGEYEVYANKNAMAPSSEYWAQRRRAASLIRRLQERLQTTELAAEELASVGDKLEAQLHELRDTPQLLGRSAWLDAERYGDYGVLHTEVTPVVGHSNPVSPQLSIWFDKDKAFASVTFGWMYEGASNIAHGGCVAAVFDEFLGNAQIISGKSGLTASLTTRYHKHTPLNQELLLEAKVKKIDGRKITMEGEMWANEVMIASCEALFIMPGQS